MTIQQVQQFLKSFINTDNIDSFRVLAQSGSARINWYAKTKHAEYIITHNENLRENEAFFYFSEQFQQLKLNTPKIFKISADRTLYIQEYLGRKTLSEIIEEEGHSTNVKSLVRQTLDKLYTLQIATNGKIDYKKTFEYEQYDHLPILHDLYYFKNFMTDVLEIPYHKSDLLKEFYAIAEEIENFTPTALMIRDFQARNIMVNPENHISFIDYQSAMKGPLIYDVISLLYQAKANFHDEFKTEMLNHYISLHQDESIQTTLKQSVEWIRLIRYLQVLGAYGFRGLIQKKKHFINSIGQGIENTFNFMETWNQANHFPELKQIVHTLYTEKSNIKSI